MSVKTTAKIKQKKSIILLEIESLYLDGEPGSSGEDIALFFSIFVNAPFKKNAKYLKKTTAEYTSFY